MLIENCLDLTRVNILAAGNDHVFQAIQEIEVTFAILIANVTGPKQTITERELRFFRIVPVATHYVCAASSQFTGLAHFNFFSRVVDNTHFDPRTSAPARRQSIPGMFLILQTRKKSRLTEPIHLNQFHVWKNLPGPVEQIGRNRRTSVSQSFKTRQVILLEVLKLSQHIDHRWNHYRVRYVFTFHDLAERSRAELRNCGLTCTESRRCKHEG